MAGFETVGVIGKEGLGSAWPPHPSCRISPSLESLSFVGEELWESVVCLVMGPANNSVGLIALAKGPAAGYFILSTDLHS